MEKFTKIVSSSANGVRKISLSPFLNEKTWKLKKRAVCEENRSWSVSDTWSDESADEWLKWTDLEVFSENALLNCVWLQPQTVEECVWGGIPCVRQDDAEHEVIVEHITTLQNEAWRHLLRSSKACVTKRQLVWKITLCFSVLTCEI